MDNYVVLAAVVVLLIVALAATWPRVCGRREGFASAQARETTRQARAVFDRHGGGTTYSAFKAAVPAADAVQHRDLKALWAQGQLTPERVEQAM
jgi:hypothetical protein